MNISSYSYAITKQPRLIQPLSFSARVPKKVPETLITLGMIAPLAGFLVFAGQDGGPKSDPKGLIAPVALAALVAGSTWKYASWQSRLARRKEQLASISSNSVVVAPKETRFKRAVGKVKQVYLDWQTRRAQKREKPNPNSSGKA